MARSRVGIRDSCPEETGARRKRPPRLPSVEDIAAAVWLRLPLPGHRCPLSGLPRTGVIDLIERSQGKIRVARLHRPGARRGVILIEKSSLLSFIDSLAGGGVE